MQKLKLTLWMLLLVSPVAVAQSAAQSAVETGSAQDALVPLLSELKSTLNDLGMQLDHASGPSSGDVRQNVEVLSLRIDTLLGMMQEQTGGAVTGGAMTGGMMTGGSVTGWRGNRWRVSHRRASRTRGGQHPDRHVAGAR